MNNNLLTYDYALGDRDLAANDRYDFPLYICFMIKYIQGVYVHLDIYILYLWS